MDYRTVKLRNGERLRLFLTLEDEFADGDWAYRVTSTPAWSCHNLIAIPTPTPAPAPCILGSSFNRLSSSPLSIALTHFTGTTTPLDRKGKSTQRSRLSATLALPPLVTPNSTARISHLSFAPFGGHLLAVTSADGQNDRLTVFQQVDGCINDWKIVWNESLGRFGEGVANGKHVVAIRWIGEPRQVSYLEKQNALWLIDELHCTVVPIT
jgi:hypothetical protein